MSLREVSSLRLDLRVDSSLEMDSFRAVISGSSVGTSSSSSDDSSSSSVAAESSTAFSSSLIRRRKPLVDRDDGGGVMTKSQDDVKAQRRATEFVFDGVKADDEAISVVSARAAAGRGVMMVVDLLE